MTDTAAEPRLLPESWPLHRVAKELGDKATHTLVAASARGEFPPVWRAGAVWYVRADLMREWVHRQHATGCDFTPAQLDRIRQAGRAGAGQPRPETRRRPRGRNASSS